MSEQFESVKWFWSEFKFKFYKNKEMMGCALIQI